MVLERRAVSDYPRGEYRSTAIYGTDNGIGAGRAFGGVLGLFASLGVGLAIVAFIAGYGVGGVQDGTANAQDAGSGVLALLVGALPLLAAPCLAVGAGGWAGYSTRSGGQGFLSGFLGAALGTIVLFGLVAVGFALGAAASGVTASDMTFDVGLDPSFAGLAGYFASIAGLVYLLVVGICAGLAGAFIGAMVPKAAVDVEHDVVRRPAV